MASMTEIAIEMQRLHNALPAPRGVDPQKAFDGYVDALKGYRIEDIHEAIDRFFAGAFPKISLKFYPRAPELGSCVRIIAAETGAADQEAKRKAAIAAERKEIDQGEELRKARTPEDKARVEAIYQKFLQDNRAARLDDLRKRKLPTPTDGLSERMAIRETYGMTQEALSGIRDRPLPKGMQQVADAAPGIPTPKTQAETDLEDFLP
jgi:hypothetical protein